MEQRQPHLALSVSDCKNLLYYLEPHEKAEVRVKLNPDAVASLEKICNYCRNRVAINEAANSDGFMFDEYYEEKLL